MTTKTFAIEYYAASDDEESDPDPRYVIRADNTDDLFTELSALLWHNDIVAKYIYADEIDGDLRYLVHDESEDANVGVAIVIYPK